MFRLNTLSSVLLLLLFHPIPASPQDTPSVSSTRAEAPIAIDGRLDDPIWNSAGNTGAFSTYNKGEPAASRTSARVAYDPVGLCVAVLCEEAQPDDVESGEADRWAKGEFNGDSIEIFVDPGGGRRTNLQFFTNIRGFRGQGLNNDYGWKAVWESAAAKAEGGWVIETRLPWSILGLHPRTGHRWGLNIARNRRVKGEGKGNEITAWSTTFGGLRNPSRFGGVVFAGPPGALTPGDGAGLAADVLSRSAGEIRGGGPWPREDFGPTERALRAEALAALAPVLARFPAPLYLAPHPAVTDRLPLPWSVPDADAVGDPVVLSACPGEFEPALVTAFTTDTVKALRLDVTDLAGPDGASLPASCIDVRWLVSWYQMGSIDIHREAMLLVPELLLHDPSLIGPDFSKRDNVRRFEKLPEDAPALRPQDVPALESRALWLTLKAPDHARPGEYRGAVVAASDRGELARLPLVVRIRPFPIAPPALDYSLYYTLRLDGKPETEAQMAAEIRNQVEHGITLPTTYENGQIEKVIDMQRAAGVRDDKPFICVTYGVGGQQTPEQIATMKEGIVKYVARVRAKGRPEAYVQGYDEASGERLRRERAAFQGVGEAGGKVFVACGSDYFDIIGDLLHMPVVSGPLVPELAKKVHKNGFRIFSYANPQSGIERPETYRRNYGLKLWAAGYDGAMNYEYQTRGEDPWDETKEGHYRFHTFAYPAKGRPVDTAQWEGWREGVDDVRYVTTLLNRLAEAEKAGRAPEKTAAIRAWLTTVNGEGDLGAAREAIAARIAELTAQ